MHHDVALAPQRRPGALRRLWPFALAALLAAGLVLVDPYLSSFVPHGFWQRLRMLDFHYKASVIVPLLLVLATWVVAKVSKARDTRSLFIVLLIVALQTNGLKLGPGLDLITLLPFVIALWLLAESLLRPSTPVQLSGLFFFATALLLLDLPYLANPLLSSPIVFVANFISVLRGLLVGLVIVSLIRDERDLELTVRALVVVALVSASISVAQTLQSVLTGNAWTLVSEEYETKPTLLGTSQRASGLTAWPSWLADFLVAALPFLLFRLVNAKTSREKLALVGGILLLLAGVVGTFTYAAYIAFAAVVCLFPLVCWPHRLLHFAVTLLLAGAVFHWFGGIEWFGHKFEKYFLASAGIIEREVYLRSTLDEITRNPWLGSGFHAELQFSENFYRKRVHNAGLQVWSNLGLAGFLVFVTMLVSILTQLCLLAVGRPGPMRQLLLALALGLAAKIVEMWAEPHMSAPLVWFHLGVCQAALILANRQPARAGGAEPRGVS